MIIKYKTSVLTPAGWRGEIVTAEATALSAKRVQVTSVLDVGDNGAAGYASRTGAKRQQYHVGGVAKREVGSVKIVSKLIEVTV